LLFSNQQGVAVDGLLVNDGN